jgi:hypothetical protein
LDKDIGKNYFNQSFITNEVRRKESVFLKPGTGWWE